MGKPGTECDAQGERGHGVTRGRGGTRGRRSSGVRGGRNGSINIPIKSMIVKNSNPSVSGAATTTTIEGKSAGNVFSYKQVSYLFNSNKKKNITKIQFMALSTIAKT